MKIKSVNLLIMALLILFSCGNGERAMKERVIVYYVDVEKKEEALIPVTSPIKEEAKKRENSVGSREKTQFKLLFDEAVNEMKEKGMLPSDLGSAIRDYNFLKRSIEKESYNGFYKRQRRLIKKIIDIKVNQSFVQEKYRRMRETVNTVEPEGKNLMNIEAKIISAEQLILERKYELANRVINEIFDMLGN